MVVVLVWRLLSRALPFPVKEANLVREAFIPNHPLGNLRKAALVQKARRDPHEIAVTGQAIDIGALARPDDFAHGKLGVVTHVRLNEGDCLVHRGTGKGHENRPCFGRSAPIVRTGALPADKVSSHGLLLALPVS